MEIDVMFPSQLMQMPRKKIRPLPLISDLVTEKMPALLDGASRCRSADRFSFMKELDSAVQKITATTVLTLSKGERQLACLDMAMLSQAHYHENLPLPDSFWKLFHTVCEKLERLPTLLYEDCVIVNPLDADPRLFCLGKEAQSERDFLLIHVKIEDKLAIVIDAMEKALYLANPDPVFPAATSHFTSEKISSLLIKAGEQLASINDSFASMYRLPKEDFARFRHFYASPPATSYFGPSGRFSAKYFAVRVMVEGKSISQVLPGFFEELMTMLPYFPSADRETMMRWIKSDYFADTSILSEDIFKQIKDSCTPCYGSLNDLAMEQPLDLELEISRLRSCLDSMNRKHFGLVHKYIVRNEEAASRA